MSKWICYRDGFLQLYLEKIINRNTFILYHLFLKLNRAEPGFVTSDTSMSIPLRTTLKRTRESRETLENLGLITLEWVRLNGMPNYRVVIERDWDFTDYTYLLEKRVISRPRNPCSTS